MFIGALKLIFSIPEGERSLKGLDHSIKTHIWTKHKVSVCMLNEPSEVAGSQSEVSMGVTFVSRSDHIASQLAQRILEDLRKWSKVELIHHELQIFHFDGDEFDAEIQEKFRP